MDFIELRQKLRDSTRKFRAALIVVLAGILLMALPSPGKQETERPPAPAAKTPALHEDLERILGKLEGAGRVQVLLTEESGPENTYLYDEDRSSGGEIRRTAVVVSDRSQGQRGLIRLTRASRYRGAVILAQGADRAAVRLSIKQAVASVTGLSLDKITVLKMK